MKKLLFISAIMVAAGSLTAQQSVQYSLQQCIDSALRKNIPLRQSRLAQEAANVNVNLAKAVQMPTIYGNVGQGLNLGRNVDPFTNDYVNQGIGYGSYGVNADVVIYNGNNIRNNIRSAESGAVAANHDLKLSKQQTILNVITAYIQLLNTIDQLEITRVQAKLSEEQLQKLELKKQKGVVAVSLVTDLRGQLLNDRLAVVDLQNTLEWYKMELSQQMNVPYNTNMAVNRISVESMLGAYGENNVEIYSSALQNFPEILAARERTKSAEYAVKAAKGLRFPQVFAGSTLGTVYTSSAEIATGKVGFGNQFVNNRSSNFSLGIRIPIFAYAIRNNIKLADINKRVVSVEEERVQNAVWQQIERGYVAMINSYKKYETLKDQLDAYRESYKAAEARFVTGVDNSFNYLAAKNNMDRANINYINARYDFILKKKVLDFYQNIE